MTTTAEALSGSWAANFRGWVASTGLASVIVVAQELATPLPNAGWIVASVLLQLVASSAWGAVVASVSRRRFGRVVPVASALLWTGIGVSRGVAGGVVAAVAGLDPEWVYRIGFWTLVTLCWMPLLTFALAKWDEHRRLLALRGTLSASLDEGTRRAAESADERARRMASAADDAIGPALDEIRAALRANTIVDDASVAAIAARLDALARRTASFIARDEALAAIRTSGRVSVNEASRDFELRRPVLAGLLTAVTTAPLVLPEAYRVGGWLQVTEVVGAIAASAALLIAAFGVLRTLRITGVQRSVLSRIGVVVAGLAGSVVLVLLFGDQLQPRDVVLLVTFPLVVATAASTTATAVALEATNVELRSRTTADAKALVELSSRVRAAEAAAAERIETLVRGDVNGRVASCALALGMLADGLPAASQERVIAGVLEQLDAAAAELHMA